jgi:hypothetical protein
MAHGRVQPSTPQIPVLTGMPVSGMAYLDRPVEAGYFIFPDLSVRHEGKYKLSFNLYEETKEAKDMDLDTVEPKRDAMGAMAADSSFHHRMEVKSAPFTVYSAKKFPGLAESTMLSRTVAEQGCRVRIRRDVRMRRRDGKGSGEFDEFEEQDFSRARRTATPESHQDHYARQRSLSHSSMDRHSYGAEPQRRPSGADYPTPAYHVPSPYAASPVPPQSNSYLAFGATPTSQYQTPQYVPPPAPQQPMSAPQSYQPSQPSYSQPSQYRAGSSSYGERQPYQPFSASGPTPRESYEQEYRRASTGYAPAPAPPQAPHYPTENGYSRAQATPAYQSFPPPPPRSQTPVMSAPTLNLAPLRMPPMEPKFESLSSPAGSLSATRMAPPLPSPSYDSQGRAGSYSHYSTPTSAVSENMRSGGKRSYDSVFPGSSAASQPLYNGMRPSDIQTSNGFDDDADDGPTMEELKMQYKRADGSCQARPLPSLE